MKTRLQRRSEDFAFDLDLSPLSPLTPALSPLRGEGFAVDVRRHLNARRRFLAPRSDEPRSKPGRGIYAASLLAFAEAPNAATHFAFAETNRRAPSPFKGERAGVRGEDGQNAGGSQSLGH